MVREEHNGLVRGLRWRLTRSTYFGASSYNTAERWRDVLQNKKIVRWNLKEEVQMLKDKYEDLSRYMIAMAKLMSQKFPGERLNAEFGLPSGKS
ncbi:hypothetical protein M5689_023844 [Euphorbia peplus]|nr:hypothetical protein M5689_023844 [Euphorbia peplus]